MTLHVFNPEHDLALAANLSNFTAPHAGRQLRADLGYISALWAAGKDVVLVENAEDAEWRYHLLLHKSFGRFVEKDQIRRLPLTSVDVWGWDQAIYTFLLRQGVNEVLLPSDDELSTIRDLSHRRFARELLSELQGTGLIGEALMTDSLDELHDHLERMGRMVVKAPWSCSGRGVRFVEGKMSLYDDGWAKNVITQQGHLMIEPFYNKVKDFGVEFESDGKGRVSYLGLSLFHTSNGAYIGNIIDSEEEKREMLGRYLSIELLDTVIDKMCHLLGELYKGKYSGMFGVDMMVVKPSGLDCSTISQGNENLLHPCVEINLRRTMGHVALHLTPLIKGLLPKVMRVTYDKSQYKLQVKQLIR